MLIYMEVLWAACRHVIVEASDWLQCHMRVMSSVCDQRGKPRSSGGTVMMEEISTVYFFILPQWAEGSYLKTP